MNRITKIGVGGAILLALAVSAPQTATAAGIGFRNDLPQPVIVQGATLVGNILHRGQPLLTFPGRLAWDNRLEPCIRIITVYDANQPTRILHREPIQFLGEDMLFAIRLGINSQVSLERLR